MRLADELRNRASTNRESQNILDMRLIVEQTRRLAREAAERGHFMTTFAHEDLELKELQTMVKEPLEKDGFKVSFHKDSEYYELYGTYHHTFYVKVSWK